MFHDKGWEIEKKILPETTWRWDAYKDKIVVSIEFGLHDHEMVFDEGKSLKHGIKTPALMHGS